MLIQGRVKNGFFIEAGADDFETDTNTLLFELKHGHITIEMVNSAI